jgi:hypothetical protein
MRRGRLTAKAITSAMSCGGMAGVVDEDIRAAELALHALGSGDDRLAVRDVRLDGDRAVAKGFGKGLDTVRAASEQRDPVAVGGQSAGGRLADAG